MLMILEYYQDSKFASSNLYPYWHWSYISCSNSLLFPGKPIFAGKITFIFEVNNLLLQLRTVNQEEFKISRDNMVSERLNQELNLSLFYTNPDLSSSPKASLRL